MARSLRTRRTRFFLLALAVVAAVGVFAAQGAVGATPNGTALRDGIRSFTDQAKNLAGQGVLGDALAFTGLDPSGVDGLDLGRVFDDIIGGAGLDEVESVDPATAPAAAAAKLEALDQTAATPADLKVSVGCPSGAGGTCSGAYSPVVATESGGIVSLTVPITVERTVAVPLDLPVPLPSGSPVQVEGSLVTVPLKLTGTLPLRLDTSKVGTAEASKAFYVASPMPAFTATATPTTDGAGVSAAAKLGFTNINAKLKNLNVALTLTATLRDPDADQKLTLDEFSGMALTDMFQLSRSGTAAGSLEFDTDLTAADPDFTHDFTGENAINLATGFEFPQVNPTALLPFRNVTPEQVISGFGQAAAALAGTQKVGDVELPFVDGALSEVISVAQPLFDFVNQQAVVCGTAQQTPPTGVVPEIVPSGTKIYCQAFVIHDPLKFQVANVNWHVPSDVSATYDASASQADKNASVTLAPTKHAVFTMTQDGPFNAHATYDLVNPESPGDTLKSNLKTERPAQTAQQLLLKLNQLGGFMNQSELESAVGSGAKVLEYDATTKALSFRLRKALPTVDEDLAYDFGDQLEKSSGVVALQGGGNVKANVTAGGGAIDITIGVLLGQLSDIGQGQPCADPTIKDGDGNTVDSNTTNCPANPLDRIFVKVNPSAPEFAIADATASIGSGSKLLGRLGFVGIEAEPTTFALAKKTSGNPVLSLNLTTPSGGLQVGSANIANAIRLRQLLFRLGDYVSTPTINLKFDAALNVTAKVGQTPGDPTSGTPLGSGTVTVSWPDVTAGLPTVTVSQTFTDTLKGFNIEPNLFGEHTGGNSPAIAPNPENPSATPAAAVLTDGSANFTDEVVGKRVDNLTDGSFCTVTGRTANTLTCDTGLGGGAVNQWRANDEYRVQVGDPLAMLWKLLDNLDAIVAGIDGLAGGGVGDIYEANLPFVGVSPKELVRQINDLKRASTELRGGPQPTIVCGLNNGNPPTGDPSQLDLAGGATKNIFCQLQSAKSASAVQWTFVQGGSAITNATDTGTVVTPTTADADAKRVTATVIGSSSDGGHIRSGEHTGGYAIRATFTDADGEHVVDFPEQSVPPTLQVFEEMLESKLNLPASAFALSPMGSGSNRRMKLDLNYALCGYEGGTAPSICSSGARRTQAFAAPLNVDLGDSGGLVGVGASADVAVTYSADARLAMSFAVSPSLDPKVEPETGIAVKGRAAANNINLTANLGPFAIRAGTGGKPSGNGAGVLKIGADFSLDNPSSTAQTISSYVSGLAADFEAPTGTGEQCGSIDLLDPHTTDTADDTAVGGIACGRLSLGFRSGSNVEYIDDVGFSITALGDDGSFTPATHVPAGFADKLAARVISWDTLLNALPELLVRIEEGLRASSGTGPDGGKVPIIGDALDAGADVVGVINDEVIPLAQTIGDTIDTALVDCTDPEVECTTETADEPNNAPCDGPDQPACEYDEIQVPDPDPEDVERFIQQFLWDELGPGGADLVRKNATSATAAVKDDIVVTALCGGGDCDGDNSLFDIDDVRITFNLGQAAGTDVENAPAFDIGFDGVPLRVAGAVEAKAGWNLLVDLGISTSDGPYLVVADSSTPGYSGGGGRPAELFVDAEVKLGAEPAANAICNSEVDDLASGDATATAISSFSASSDRCLAGKLGFVSVNMRDEDTAAKRTRAGIETSLDLRKKSAPNATALTKLKLLELVSGELLPVAALDVDARVNLRFRTGISGTQSAGFPTVVGTFKLAWGFEKAFGGAVAESASGLQPLTIKFENLFLDMSAFFQKYLKPTLDEVRNIVGPFKPVIDTLNAPIPVVSDLAALVGQPPLTLLGLMELISGNNLTVVKSLAKFVSFAVDLASDPNFGNGLIALGGGTGAGAAGAFPLLTAPSDRKKLGSNPGPANADSLINKLDGAYSAGKDLLQRPSTTGGSNAAAVTKASNTGLGVTKDNLPGTFGVPGLTFPFMSDASQIFGFVMGQDITLIRYDVGTLKATAGFSYNFGPFMIGPVPVTAGIGGSATLEGRFALGYDTSGLRKVLSGGSGVYLFDGIFIDDLDASLVDVAEIKLIGEVYARAGVTVFIATAGIEGGIRMTVALNLDDRPDPDGKLRIEEVFNKLSNPICLFEVSGKLEAFLKAFLEINYFVGSEKWDWTILQITLLEFSGACEPPRPQLASQSGGTLTLNMGTDERRTARKISTGTVDEKFIVRPVGNGRYSVEAFGVHQVYGPNAPFGGPAAITTVVADGDTGNDTILMQPGTDETNADPKTNQVPFSAVAQLSGGPGNDVLNGGEANDPLNGNDGNDKIDGNGGNDTITGGGDSDQLNGGQGNDNISGEGGTDRLSGGPGGDTLNGGGDNDILTGGPGSDPNDSATVPATRDGNDTMIGGTGADSLEGGFGTDVMHGDAAIACAAAGTPGGDDIIDGGPDNDTMTGGAANDKMVGGPGNDTLCGNDGHDELDGDDASMEATGGGRDDLNGGANNDVLRGRSGRDVLHGDADSDVLFGGAGADHLLGDGGDDDLLGAVGNDVLDGGGGTNILVGDSATIAGAENAATNRRDMPASQAARVALVSNIGTAGDNSLAPSCTYNRSAAGTTVDLGFADCITGGSGDDVLFGEGGKDDMTGDGAADYMRGGDHEDTMRGNAGTDEMYGDLHDDTMTGGTENDTMRGNEGADYMEGNGGTDTMRGDADDDRMIGGSSTSAADANDIMDGDGDEDVMAGDNATITATLVVNLLDVSSADTTLHGGDTMNGGPHDDVMFGQGGVDTMNGDVGLDRVIGNGAGDTINGNADDDLLIGGSSQHATLRSAGPATAVVAYGDAPDGGDTINGNEADDLIFGDNVDADFDALKPTKPVFADSSPLGSFGDDILTGNDGQDVLWGELGGDTMNGSAGEDYLVGDLATVDGDAAGNPRRTWPGGAPEYTVTLVQATVGGADTMNGDDADDHLFGGAAVDTMSGGLGDDYMEGNAGQDEMYGLSATHDDDDTTQPSDVAELNALLLGASDEDDMIGGSSTMSWLAASTTVGSDTGETKMHGNADHDVMAGDNADISRVVDPTDATQWADDLVLNDARRRDVSLRDREKDPDSTPKLSEVSGADDMFGNGGFDRMYGEGGDDRMKGNDSDDYLEGNQGTDWLEGNDGEDDLIGGSSFELSNLSQTGDPDAADFLHGGDDSDVITGDNAVISRTAAGAATPVYFNTTGRFLGFTTPRWIRLLDLAAPSVTTRYGNDFVSGGAGQDLAFGQDGDDAISGGPADDYLEGNGAVDRVYGDRMPWDSTVTARFPSVPGSIGNADGSGFRSAAPQLDGPPDPDGQDDILGGSALVGHRDGQGTLSSLPDPSKPFTSTAFEARFGDYLFGDGDDDFVVGDNGTLTRFSPDYLSVSGTYMTSIGNNGVAHRLVREAVRHDVVAPASGSYGDDFVEGNDGDDAVWAQNGNDEVWGNDGDDELFGEVGDDRAYGGHGEDAVVGDRGSVKNTWVTEAMRADGNFTAFDIDTAGPPFLVYKAFTTHRYDRRVDLHLDVVGSVGGLRPQVENRVLLANDHVGSDTIRGGQDHDSLHGGYGDDFVNGDTGGDYVFGGSGADLLWGGRGSTETTTEDLRQPAATEGFDDRWVDYVFGGRGSGATTTNGIVTGGADVIDFRPRTDQPVGKKGETVTDDAAWHENVSPYASRHADQQEILRQHHHGVDWIWGGWDRDVMQANVAGQGPNDRDRLMDWSGAYNLYTHCEPDYGGYNDVRVISPLMVDIQNQIAFASGAGESLANVQQADTSGYEEAAVVYHADVSANSGKAYPATPGHFTEIACSPETP